MTEPTKDHKRVSPEGKNIGRIWAGLADKAFIPLIAEGEADERCKSCAFRLGTVPNGCAQTQLDVTKAVLENVPFMCHVSPATTICHGWYAIRVQLRQRGAIGKIRDVGYEFSPPDEPKGRKGPQP